MCLEPGSGNDGSAWASGYLSVSWQGALEAGPQCPHHWVGEPQREVVLIPELDSRTGTSCWMELMIKNSDGLTNGLGSAARPAGGADSG